MAAVSEGAVGLRAQRNPNHAYSASPPPKPLPPLLRLPRYDAHVSNLMYKVSEGGGSAVAARQSPPLHTQNHGKANIKTLFHGTSNYDARQLCLGSSGCELGKWVGQGPQPLTQHPIQSILVSAGRVTTGRGRTSLRCVSVVGHRGPPRLPTSPHTQKLAYSMNYASRATSGPYAGRQQVIIADVCVGDCFDYKKVTGRCGREAPGTADTLTARASDTSSTRYRPSISRSGAPLRKPPRAPREVKSSSRTRRCMTR